MFVCLSINVSIAVVLYCSINPSFHPSTQFWLNLVSFCHLFLWCLIEHVTHLTGAEEKMNVELIMPIGAVVIAMFLWLLIVFVIRNRKRVTFHLFLFSLFASPLSFSRTGAHFTLLTDQNWLPGLGLRRLYCMLSPHSAAMRHVHRPAVGPSPAVPQP